VLRVRLDRALAEVDRRRHELTDVRLQVRRHPGIAAGTAVALLGLLGGVAFVIWRGRASGEKILVAVGTAVAVTCAKKLVDKLLNAVPTYRDRRSPGALLQ
jgi:hypothetical protein